MTRSWTVTILKHEQPGEEIWREISRLVTAWNAGHASTFVGLGDLMWQVTFDAGARPEMERLITELEGLERRTGVTYHVASRGILEEEDYARADFIEILGVGLGDPSRPFLLNEASALAPSAPCLECGSHDAFDSIQIDPLVIDETQLDRIVDDERPPDERGWDLVNLPNGGKLVSRRLASVLESGDVEGYDLIEVIDGATGRPSTRLFQLIAGKVVLTPCIEHSRIDGMPFCSSCGTARGDLQDYFRVRSDWIGDDEVISRHPNKSAMLYVSRRVYEWLVSARLNGLHRNDVLFVCRHD